MRLTALATLALTGGFWSGAALAAPVPAPAPGSTAPAATVSPLTVSPATAAPKMVRSFPTGGQALSAGVTVISVTFDQPMLKTGFDVGPAAGGETPHCLKTPRLLNDNKTFVLLCTTEPHKAYTVAFNARPDGGFRNLGEHRAAPSTLAFTTTDPDGPRDVHEAMKAAKLTDLDMPIQDSPDRQAEKTPP